MASFCMRAFRLAFLAGSLCSAAAAPAKTIIIFVEPMTLEKHTQIVESRGPDRFLMCMQPPSLIGCRELTPRKRV